MMISKFPCTQCGLCCTNPGREFQSAFLKEEGLLDENGRCIHLKETAREDGKPLQICGIYSNRPLLCRTDVVEQLIKPKSMSRILFQKILALGCNLLQENEGVDESYRVRIPTSASSGEVHLGPDQSDG